MKSELNTILLFVELPQARGSEKGLEQGGQESHLDYLKLAKK
jgi:hypothetical protein